MRTPRSCRRRCASVSSERRPGTRWRSSSCRPPSRRNSWPGRWHCPTLLPLTERLEHAFAARVEELPPTTKTQLLIAALNDSDDLGEVLAASAAMAGGSDAVHSLEIAALGGLIDLDAVGVRFRHPLMRSTVAQVASGAERRAVHTALAQVLGCSSGPTGVAPGRVDRGHRRRRRERARGGGPTSRATRSDRRSGRGAGTGGRALPRAARQGAASDASRRARLRARST